MKKSIFTLSVVALFIGQQVYAQTPWHTSGDSAMPGSFIGSTNKTNLLFKTNDSTRICTETLRSAQGDNTVDISNQPSGVHVYRIITKQGEPISYGKFIINK